MEYLFNGESYDFNYQFENRLPKPIQLYPVRMTVAIDLIGRGLVFQGDELATRCVYNTMNKAEVTVVREQRRQSIDLTVVNV